MIAALKDDGYTVEQGHLYFETNGSSAFGANPDTIYGLYDFNGATIDVASHVPPLFIVNDIELAFWRLFGTSAIL